MAQEDDRESGLLGEALADRRRREERAEAWELERLAGLREAQPRMRELVELFHAHGYEARPLIESWRRLWPVAYNSHTTRPSSRLARAARRHRPVWEHRSTGVAAWGLIRMNGCAMTPDLELWTTVTKREVVKKWTVEKCIWMRSVSVDPRALFSTRDDVHYDLNFLLVQTALSVIDGNYPRPELGWHCVH